MFLHCTNETLEILTNVHEVTVFYANARALNGFCFANQYPPINMQPTLQKPACSLQLSSDQTDPPPSRSKIPAT